MASGGAASIRPGSRAERIAIGASAPFRRIRTSVPSALISAAVGARQTSVASCPAIAIFVASSDP